MKKTVLTFLALGLAVSFMPGTSTAQGFQTQGFQAARPQGGQAPQAILMDLYGQGVHAYYCQQHSQAHDHLSAAINHGIQDPRAFYFRGMVAHSMGRPHEAETDWEQGARLEARGKNVGSIGRSLSRFQGSGRLKLEEIRQKAKLQYLSEASMRSQQRFGEIQSLQGDVLRSAPLSGGQRTPPPLPSTADESPFSDDQSEPAIDADDALSDAMDAPSDDAPAAASDAPAASSDDGDDPFGGGDGDDADPFGSDDGGDDDPFGDDSDPFG